jgi:predicted ArsR family transcriptional regulator
MLTAAGRARFGEHQESLGLSAVKYLNSKAGPGAVTEFASSIAKDFVSRHKEISQLETIEERAVALIDALNQDGFAIEFPALCEEETKAFSELTGVHVTRLATIAKGHAVCTTLVPHTRRENA